MAQQPSPTRPALWWVEPGNFLLGLTLPIFLLSAALGSPLMEEQFSTTNFLSADMILFGGLSICLLALGAKIGRAMAGRPAAQTVCFHPQRFDAFAVFVLLLAIAAHILLIGSVLLDFSLITSVFRGERGAAYEAKAAMDKLVGVTSLTNIAPLFWTMSSVRRVTTGRFFPSKVVAITACCLALLIFLHSFLGSGRLMLLANGICFALPLLSFSERLKRVAPYLPIVGLVGVVLLFAAGEYTRTWAFYESRYGSFAEFVGLRLLAYIAVAANTGAGLIVAMPTPGYPLLTGTWMLRLPFVGGDPTSFVDEFFRKYANEEFNNPSGIFAPVVDFGWTIGAVYLLLWGVLLGVIFAFYQRRHPVSLLAYPIFYIGLADLTQIWYWGQPPFIPQLLFLAAAVVVTVRRPVLRQHRV